MAMEIDGDANSRDMAENQGIYNIAPPR
jgi:hypothetical protein